MNIRIAHYVGTYLCNDSRLYLCVAYEPRIDYFVCAVDDGEPRFTDISTRAIGRTFHEDWKRDRFSRPDQLVLAVRKSRGESVIVDMDIGNSEEEFVLSRVFDAAQAYWAKFKRRVQAGYT